MELTINPPKDVVVMQQRMKTINKITVREVTDSPVRKIVVAHTLELGRVVLWKDAEYDAIGQWTDTDVINRLTALYAN